ncbi:MAG: MGMT family protein [Chloroflexi bacterium]|nr:MGMT family protein [Chloroflexota bacterium]
MQIVEPRLFDLIYAVVRQIPAGRVATYGQISCIVGRCSAQMVGFALAALGNQKTVRDVPWQRVINAKGKISPHGYGFGTAMQRALLEEEGIEFGQNDEIDLGLFGWDETGNPLITGEIE